MRLLLKFLAFTYAGDSLVSYECIVSNVSFALPLKRLVPERGYVMFVGVHFKYGLYRSTSSHDD